MFALITHKPLLSFIIFSCSVIGGMLPISLRMDQNSRLLASLAAGSRGLFLGLGLMHFFPEALSGFSQHEIGKPVWPFLANHASLCCASIILLTISVLIFTEKRLKLQSSPHEASHWLAYLVLFFLSLHSFFAGLALGIESTAAGTMVVFIAIISHKSFAAFALGVKMRMNDLPRNSAVWLLLLFSLMTPMGIFLGVYIHLDPANSLNYLSNTLLHTFLAGLFIYLAIFESADEKMSEPVVSIGTFCIGFAVSAVISLWLT